MRTDWVFRRCPRYLRRLVEQHWSTREHRIERLLTHFAHNICELQVSLKRIGQPATFEGHMVLRLPTATIRVQSRSPDAIAVVDDLIDQLTRRITRHVERLGKDSSHRRRNRRKPFAVAESGWLPETPELAKASA